MLHLVSPRHAEDPGTLADGPRPLAGGHQLNQQHPHRAHQIAPVSSVLGGLAMVIHYQPARLRHNSDRPTAITNVLVATSGSSSRTGDIELAPRPARPAPARAAGRCTPTATRSWSSGRAARWPVHRSRSPGSSTVWAVITTTVSTTRPPRQSGSSCPTPPPPTPPAGRRRGREPGPARRWAIGSAAPPTCPATTPTRQPAGPAHQHLLHRSRCPTPAQSRPQHEPPDAQPI